MGLTGAQRAHLHDEGWIRLEQVLSPAQVREMNAAWDRWQERVGPEELEAEAAFQPCLQHPLVAEAVRGGGW